jgi:hypothetical protein
MDVCQQVVEAAEHGLRMLARRLRNAGLGRPLRMMTSRGLASKVVKDADEAVTGISDGAKL